MQRKTVRWPAQEHAATDKATYASVSYEVREAIELAIADLTSAGCAYSEAFIATRDAVDATAGPSLRSVLFADINDVFGSWLPRKKTRRSLQ